MEKFKNCQVIQQRFFMNPTKYFSEDFSEIFSVVVNGKEIIVLGEVILSQQGCFTNVKRYVQGKHPELGVLHFGLSGDWETIWETSIIKAINCFSVFE